MERTILLNTMRTTIAVVWGSALASNINGAIFKMQMQIIRVLLFKTSTNTTTKSGARLTGITPLTKIRKGKANVIKIANSVNKRCRIFLKAIALNVHNSHTPIITSDNILFCSSSISKLVAVNNPPTHNNQRMKSCICSSNLLTVDVSVITKNLTTLISSYASINSYRRRRMVFNNFLLQ
jgi:hypothetical protein